MTALPPKRMVLYPSSDGQPMADNTLQFQWIVTIQGNLDLMYWDLPDVFVAGDHLIYPVEGNVLIRQAPDAYVAFGRPKRHRGSYVVCEEDGIFPQVIFEVWSPSNRVQQMELKRQFYETYGAEEYYLIYPDTPATVDGWLRREGKLEPLPEMNGLVSPRLGIRFQMNDGELKLYKPDGQKFLSFVELGTRAEADRHRAEQEEVRAEQERQRAEQEKHRAEEERRRAESAEVQAEQERQRAERLAARLRELGIDPDAG